MRETETAKTPRTASRYRKVEVRTWGDEKFRGLTAMPACGQGLWLYLITGPHTGPIPGLFRAGRAGMAEELDWEQEAFDEAFREVFQQGMVKADFKARVMWVPNAIKHNKPESPNVVKSWAAEFDLIPECDLKREAYEHLRSSIHALGEAFGKAFDETFGKPSAKPSTKAMPNQEQEQEQEQEQDTSSSLRSEEGRVAKSPAPSPSGRQKREETTLAKYLADCREKGVKPVPDDHSIRTWAQDAGISDEMLQVAWLVFRERYTEDSQYKAKRYKDWVGTFANSVKDRWFSLWFAGEGGVVSWSSTGLQHKQVLDARVAKRKEQEAAHATA